MKYLLMSLLLSLSTTLFSKELTFAEKKQKALDHIEFKTAPLLAFKTCLEKKETQDQSGYEKCENDMRAVKKELRAKFTQSGKILSDE